MAAILRWHFQIHILYNNGCTYTKISLATLDGKIVDPGITVKLEIRDVFKVHDAQT